MLVFSIVDRLLGGAGTTLEEIRLFTDIEQSIMANVVQKSLGALAEAWSSVSKMSFTVIDREMNPQFCQILATNETVVSVTLEVTIKDVTGIVSICIPFISLEPLIGKLSAQHKFGAALKELDEKQKAQIVGTVYSAAVTASFEIGRTHLTIRELLELQRDDIVVLDKSVKSPCTMCVEKIPKFVGSPGLVSRKKGFKILQKL